MLYLTNSQPFSAIMAQSDRYEARPLEMLGVELAQIFSPDSIDGFLWLALLLRFTSAILLHGILCELFKNRTLALIACLLFIVNPSESWRFLAIVMMDYYLALMLLLLGIWLYLYSYRLGNRRLLIAGCALLVVTLLIRESSILLAIAVPGLIFAMPKQQNRRLWLMTWIVSVTMMGARFGLFMVNTPDSYQQSLAIHLTSFSQIVDNLRAQFVLTFSFFTPSMTMYSSYELASVLMAIVVAIGAILLGGGNQLLNRCFKGYGVGILLAVVGILLAIAPYFAFSDLHRTQFFAAPLQAVLWALVITLIAGLLTRRLQKLWIMIAVGFLILSSVTGAWQYQEAQTKIAAPFSKIASIFEQVHRIAPRFVPGTLVLFVISDGTSPFGARNYQLTALSRLVLGVDACQMNLTQGQNPIFTPDGVITAMEATAPLEPVDHYIYSQIVAFNIDPDGVVTLLETLPEPLPPFGVLTHGYNPHTRIQTANPTPLPFLHASVWARSD